MQLVYLHGFATNPQVWHNQKVDYSPELCFEDIDAESNKLAGNLKPETILIGWSMGGMLALKTTELAGNKIKALVLVSTTPKFIRSPDFPLGLPMALLKRLENKIRAEGTAAFHNLVFKNGESMGLNHLSWEEVEKEFNQLAQIDLRGLLSKVSIPTLIIHGDRDEICPPSAAEYMKENISGSELVMLPGVGHAPMVEVPELFNSQLDRFIKKHA